MDSSEAGKGGIYKGSGRFTSLERTYNNDSAINLPQIINPYNMIQQGNLRTLRNENKHYINNTIAAPNQPIKGIASHRPSVSNLLMKHQDNVTIPDYQGFSVISQSKKLHEQKYFQTPHKMRSNSTLSNTASGMIMNGSQPDLHNGPDSAGRGSPIRNYESRNPYKHHSTHARPTLNHDDSSMMMGAMGIDSASMIIESPGKKKEFGIEGYYVPGTMHNIIKVSKWQKKDVKRFTDIYAESRKFVPPPNTYNVKDIDKISDTHKYRIYATDRKTYFEEVPK